MAAETAPLADPMATWHAGTRAATLADPIMVPSFRTVRERGSVQVESSAMILKELTLVRSVPVAESFHRRGTILTKRTWYVHSARAVADRLAHGRAGGCCHQLQGNGLLEVGCILPSA